MGRVTLLSLLVLFFCFPLAGNATEPVLLYPNMDALPLGDYMEVLEDPSHTITIESLLTGDLDHRFMCSKSPIPNFGMTRSAIWSRFWVVNNSDEKQQWLFMAAPSLFDTVDLYFRYEDGRLEHRQSGLTTPITQREYDHRNFVFWLETQPREIVGVYTKLTSESSIMLEFYAASPVGFERLESSIQWVYGVNLGVLLTLILFNLLLFFSIREKNYLYFVLWQVGSLLYFTSLGGYVPHVFLPYSSWFAVKAPLIFGAIYQTTGVLFSRSFLEMKLRNPKADRFALGILGVSIFCGLLSLVDYYLANFIIAANAMVLFIFFAVYCFVDWRRGHALAGYYLLSFLFFIFSGFYFILAIYGLVVTSPMAMHCWPIGFNLGGILFSFALGHRYHALQRNYHAELQSRIDENTKSLEQTVHALHAEVFERKRIEQIISESESRYRLLADNASDIIWTMDLDLNLTYISPSVQKLLGYTAVEFIQQQLPVVLSDESLQLVKEFADNELNLERQGKSNPAVSPTFELELKHKDGTLIWTETRTNYLRGENDKPVGILGATRDITERRQAEAALRESEEKYRLLADNVTDVIWVMDTEMNFTYRSPSVARLRGYTYEEAASHSLSEILSPSSLNRFLSTWQEHVSLEKEGELPHDATMTIELELKHKNGSTIWAELNATTLRDANGKVTGILGTTRDVTDRKMADDLLFYNLELVKLINSISTMFINLKPQQIDKGINDALEEIGHFLGISRCLVIMISRNESHFSINYQWAREGFEPCAANERKLPVDAFSWWPTQTDERKNIYLTDVDQLPVDAAMEREWWAAWNCESLLALPLDQSFRIIGHLVFISDKKKTYSSEEIALLESMATIIVNALERKQVGFELTRYSEKLEELVQERTRDLREVNEKLHHDIVERIRAEKEKVQLEEQLRQSQKMEAVGQLAGGVAHDFNNLLTGITGNISLALLDLHASDPLRKVLEEINQAADRATDLTRQLLAFSRKQVIEPKIIDINKTLDILQKMLRHIIGEDVELITKAKKGLGLVKADPNQLEQIIINLAVNARDAMPSGGRLMIETDECALDEEHYQLESAALSKTYILLRISDNGHGMDAETRLRIFEPFFTTKPMGKGTGLGLSTVYGIVRQHDGIIDVESEVDQGTTFNIYFPRVEAESETVDRSRQSLDLPGGQETVLMVEDEKIVLEMNLRVLQRLGYSVLHADNGGEALLLCKQHQQNIDLLMTDVVMPQMNGRELAEHLRDIQPNIKILFTSGYSDDVVINHGVANEGINFLGKPYTISALARKIREVLDT